MGNIKRFISKTFVNIALENAGKGRRPSEREDSESPQLLIWKFEMRTIILVDSKNFEQGVIDLSRKRNEFRYIDFYKLNNFLMEYIKKNTQYSGVQLIHIRTYLYTGEYTDNLIKKIEKYVEKRPAETVILKDLVNKCKREKDKQNTFFNFAKNYYFFEIKTKPLQFSYSDIKIIQKGIDVQIASDLVDLTHKNIFDIALVLSGDIDLLESIKIAKNMGKQIIIFGNSTSTAEEMKKYADLFIDIGRFTKEQLDQFTHIPKIRK